MKKVYDLDLKDVIDHLVSGGSVRGENFVGGIFLRLDRNGRIALVDAKNIYSEDINVSLSSLSRQKFRKLTIMTVKELTD